MAGSKTEALFFLLVWLLVVSAAAEGPYRSYDWKVTYGDINPLDTPQQARTIFFALWIQSAKLWSVLKYLAVFFHLTVNSSSAVSHCVFMHAIFWCTGDSYQRAVSGAEGWVPDGWQLDHQRPQQLAGALLALMVRSDRSRYQWTNLFFCKLCPVSKISEDDIVSWHAATNCYMSASIGYTHYDVWRGSGSFSFTMHYMRARYENLGVFFSRIYKWARIVRECWWLWNHVQI